MAADSFHHQVESLLKRMGKVYDFQDFVMSATKASKNVNITEMDISRFYSWVDHSSQYKLTRTTPRPYLNNMVYVLIEVVTL